MEFTLTFLNLFALSIYLLWPILALLSAIIIVLGQIVTHLEGWHKFEGLYWSLITATTVGYGDIRPVKKRSKILSALIAIIGILFTGIIVAAAVKTVSISIEKHIDPIKIQRIKNAF